MGGRFSRAGILCDSFLEASGVLGDGWGWGPQRCRAARLCDDRTQDRVAGWPCAELRNNKGAHITRCDGRCASSRPGPCCWGPLLFVAFGLDSHSFQFSVHRLAGPRPRLGMSGHRPRAQTPLLVLPRPADALPAGTVEPPAPSLTASPSSAEPTAAQPWAEAEREQERKLRENEWRKRISCLCLAAGLRADRQKGEGQDRKKKQWESAGLLCLGAEPSRPRTAGQPRLYCSVGMMSVVNSAPTRWVE